MSMYLYGRPPGLPQNKTPLPSGNRVQNGLVAGGRNAAELHPSIAGLVRTSWIYAPSKYGSREMRRIGPALGRTSCQISPS
jgi:hypothetical protein